MNSDEIKELLDKGLEGHKALEKGEQSETFFVNSSVVQAPEMGEEQLPEKNAFLHSHLSDNNVPVPEVLYHQESPAFTLYNRIEGLDLVEAEEQLSREEFLDVIKESGRTLAKIHEVEGNGYGEPDPNNFRVGQCSNWRDFIDRKTSEIEQNVEAWRFNIIIDKALDYLEIDEIPERPDSRAFHNDYGRENIIYDGEEAHAIDLDHLIYGDPRLEFVEAESLLTKGRKEAQEAFRQGYSQDRNLDLDESLEDNYVAVAVLKSASIGDYVTKKRENPDLTNWVEGLHTWLNYQFE